MDCPFMADMSVVWPASPFKLQPHFRFGIHFLPGLGLVWPEGPAVGKGCVCPLIPPSLLGFLLLDLSGLGRHKAGGGSST